MEGLVPKLGLRLTSKRSLAGLWAIFLYSLIHSPTSGGYALIANGLSCRCLQRKSHFLASAARVSQPCTAIQRTRRRFPVRPLFKGTGDFLYEGRSSSPFILWQSWPIPRLSPTSTIPMVSPLLGIGGSTSAGVTHKRFTFKPPKLFAPQAWGRKFL